MAANRTNINVIDLTEEEFSESKFAIPKEQKFMGSPEKKFSAMPFLKGEQKDQKKMLTMSPDIPASKDEFPAPTQNSIVLTKVGCPVEYLYHKVLIGNAKNWHKFTILNRGGMGRQVILKAVLDAVHPHDLVPCMYRVDGISAYFFARNCFPAIEKLCHQYLTIVNHAELKIPLELNITIAHMSTMEKRINVQENIMTVITKRYNQEKAILDLERFYLDPGLIEYTVLSQPRILYLVLHIAKTLLIETLKLGYNDLRNLSPLEQLFTVRGLMNLDLSNNLLELADLNPIKGLPLKELVLDGNPLCEKFDEIPYVESVKRIVPKILKLDGAILGSDGFLIFRKHLLCHLNGRSLAEQFLEHFFALYDSKDRSVMAGLHHQDAIFSFTCQYLNGHSTSTLSNLTHYKMRARNIMMVSDLSKLSHNLTVGADNIIDMYNSLPPTEHDPHTFTVDMPYYTETTAVIVVTGVFRETSSKPEQLYGFTRSFVLLAAKFGEYNIVNEQLHVTNATSAQVEVAFKKPFVFKQLPGNIDNASTKEEKKEMVLAMRKITNLNFKWCRKCLEDCQYNFKQALNLFIDLHKLEKIPDEAFTA